MPFKYDPVSEEAWGIDVVATWVTSIDLPQVRFLHASIRLAAGNCGPLDPCRRVEVTIFASPTVRPLCPHGVRSELGDEDLRGAGAQVTPELLERLLLLSGT